MTGQLQSTSLQDDIMSRKERRTIEVIAAATSWAIKP
jgi:hypothetical protein